MWRGLNFIRRVFTMFLAMLLVYIISGMISGGLVTLLMKTGIEYIGWGALVSVCFGFALSVTPLTGGLGVLVVFLFTCIGLALIANSDKNNNIQ